MVAKKVARMIMAPQFLDTVEVGDKGKSIKEMFFLDEKIRAEEE